MEITEQALSGLKERMAAALQAQKQSLLEFAAGDRTSAEDIYAALVHQAEETAGVYPEFDLKLELKNGEFLAMLRSGLTMRRAYEAAHHTEIVEAALAYGLRQGVPQRPSENGLAGQASAATAGGMAASTRQQRDAIRSRVSRGETVRL